MMRYLDKRILARARRRVLSNLGPILTKWKFRRCGCCNRCSLFIQFGQVPALQTCTRCAASLRYEMLGRHIRQNYDLGTMRVLELDPASSLRSLLRTSKEHIRSYFRADHMPGAMGPDGAIMQDITRLTYGDDMFDMIVSSDVLEHVPNAMAAYRESCRVLRPGGVHVFTVPNQPITRRLAEIRDGAVHQIVTPPEYHSDPLDRRGILAFWHFGPDLQAQFADSGLCFTRFELSDGPERTTYVWEARKPPSAN